MARGARNLIAAYNQRVKSGELQRSEAQLGLLRLLEERREALKVAAASSGGLFGWLAGARAKEPIRGLYIWGGVGRGKTMLMDMFFARVSVRAKRRLHFHEFMAEVHERITDARSRHPGDPIPIVAGDIVQDATLLCFDELHVTDIADAMILGRLFRHMFAKGVTVIATSNVPPDGLYKDGLNRDLFIPFIRLIDQFMEVHEFGGATDYRLEKLSGRKLYFSPLGAEADKAFDALWIEYTDGAKPAPTELKSLGRTIPVPLASDGIAKFGFKDLCEAALGPRDYLMVAKRYHTVFLSDVPILGPEKRNAARRFINLIDTLYDARAGLIISADAEPEGIYRSGDGVELFARTASRLTEMRSADYLADREARVSAMQTQRAELEPLASSEHT